MGRNTRFAVLLMLGASLQGCAVDRLRVERAGEVVSAGQPLVAAASTTLNEVAKSSVEAGVEFAATDPSCDWPEIRVLREPSPKALCAPASAAPATFFTLTTTDKPRMAATITLVAALGDYVDAVDAVVSEDPVDAGAALGRARAELEGIVGDLSTIANRPKPELLADDQFAAIQGIAGFIGELAQEADQARRLKIIEKNNVGMGEVAKRIGADVGLWTNLGLVSNLRDIENLRVRTWRVLRQSPQATEADRRAVLLQRVAVGQRIAAANALPAALNKAVAAFVQAHAEYANALDGRKLSPANRARAAQITRERLRRTLSLIADTLAAFR